MRLDEIRNRVINIISDSSYSPDEVDKYINQAMDYCLGVVDVPEFKRPVTVTTKTDQAYLQLGDEIDNYGGRVSMAKYNGGNLKIYSTLDHMLEDYEDFEQTGDLESVCLEGRNLWYLKIPETASTVLLLCYLNPEPLSKNNAEIEWMPNDCHVKILVNGACHFIFDQIEEEDSGKPMAFSYKSKMDDGITDFRGWISRNRRNVGYGIWRY